MNLFEGIEVHNGFKTTDGSLFNELGEAQKHQTFLNQRKYITQLVNQYAESSDEFISDES